MRRAARETGVYQVDGTRDRPPGKTAQNWGRRDGIRAGAVSGPWRSAPLETPERRRLSGRWCIPRLRPARPAQSRLQASTHNAAAESHVRHSEHELGRSRNRRLMGSVVWIAFGAVVAISCIVAAFVFRPDSTLPARVDAPLAEPVAPVTEAVPIRSLTIADDTQIETAAAAADPPASATPPAPPARRRPGACRRDGGALARRSGFRRRATGGDRGCADQGRSAFSEGRSVAFQDRDLARRLLSRRRSASSDGARQADRAGYGGRNPGRRARLCAAPGRSRARAARPLGRRLRRHAPQASGRSSARGRLRGTDRTARRCG